jgi:hypothetical protein
MQIGNDHLLLGVRHAELRLPCGDEPHTEQNLPGRAPQVSPSLLHLSHGTVFLDCSSF